jgi:hypothetical protein
MEYKGKVPGQSVDKPNSVQPEPVPCTPFPPEYPIFSSGFFWMQADEAGFLFFSFGVLLHWTLKNRMMQFKR